MGKLFDKLDHKEELGAWISYYNGSEKVSYNRHHRAADLEHLMRFWEAGKAHHLYDIFGEQFVIEKAISFERTDNDLADQVRDAYSYDGPMYNFRSNFRDWVSRMETKGVLSYREAYFLRELVSASYLATNKYEGDLIKLNIGGTNIAIQNGCKPSRVLGKIAQAAGIEGFEAFRIAHSNILAEKMQKGVMCLSIHPLDYLTMSDNTYDWESCMNWRNSGCYRIGTVEMMNSPCVVVAYIKGQESMRFGNFEWNSKKWRNLFIVNSNLICGIKGYPYQSDKFDKICIEMLRDLAETNLGFTYCDDIVEHYFDCQSEVLYIEELDKNIRFDFETRYMYPDFGNNNTTHLVVSKDARSTIKCNYSGPTECMYCGELMDESNYDCDDCSYVICNDCMAAIKCEHCGCRISADDEVYELDGTTMCYDCYQDRAVYDPFDEQYHDCSNVSTVYLVADKYALPMIKDGYANNVEEVYKDYRYFKNSFFRLGLYEDSIDFLPVTQHVFPHTRWAWWGDLSVNVINLDEIKDEALANRIATAFEEYGDKDSYF